MKTIEKAALLLGIVRVLGYLFIISEILVLYFQYCIHDTPVNFTDGFFVIVTLILLEKKK